MSPRPSRSPRGGAGARARRPPLSCGSLARRLAALLIVAVGRRGRDVPDGPADPRRPGPRGARARGRRPRRRRAAPSARARPPFLTQYLGLHRPTRCGLDFGDSFYTTADRDVRAAAPGSGQGARAHRHWRSRSSSSSDWASGCSPGVLTRETGATRLERCLRVRHSASFGSVPGDVAATRLALRVRGDPQVVPGGREHAGQRGRAARAGGRACRTTALLARVVAGGDAERARRRTTSAARAAKRLEHAGHLPAATCCPTYRRRR